MELVKVLEQQIDVLQKDIQKQPDWNEYLQLHSQLTRCIELYAKINGWIH